jgi:hypothetical protein
MGYSEYIRFALDRMSGRVPVTVYEPQAPPAREKVVGEVSPGRVESVPEVGKGRLPGLDSYAQVREAARDLAQREGRCTADVARGTRCKLCSKVH